MANRIRIKFYSVNDWSAGSNLSTAESLFQNWDSYINSTAINDLLELYNVKKYIDSGMRLNQWDDIQFSDYKARCELIPGIIGRYCSVIQDRNLLEICHEVESNYLDDFWQILCACNVYKRIEESTFLQLLNSDNRIVWYVLTHKELPKAFGEVITKHLLKNPYTAERLIIEFLEKHDERYIHLFFPVQFTPDMKKNVVLEYIEREDANLNYLQLLERSQNSAEFPLDDRLRLRARKRKEFFQNKLFSENNGMRYGAEVKFKSIPDGSIEETFTDDNIISCSYSKEWIDENRDYPTLLNNFIYMFQFVDRFFRCQFVALKSELGVVERFLGLKGEKEYLFGVGFEIKRMLSLLQMIAYNQELKLIDVRLEDVFKWFFEDYLKDEFNVQGFTYNPPSEGTTYAEKCKLISISIDGVLKQYRLFVEDGEINRELYEMSSRHIIFKDIKSMISGKYGYANSDAVRQEMFWLFSDQSMLSYTEKTKNSYKTLPQLLLSEKITRRDFAEYQQPQLDWLIERSAIVESDDGRLLVNKERVVVLQDLFINEVICPNYYDAEMNKQIDLLEQSGDLYFENTLFSKVEQDYLNFMLNKAEFSNGFDLRNRYDHDTNSLDEKTHQTDYMEFQKIMVLIIIKINEEFCLREKKCT